MKLGEALCKIYSTNIKKINDFILLSNLLDLCYDTYENKEYAKLYCNIHKQFDMFFILKNLGLERGIDELLDRYKFVFKEVNKKDYQYLVDAIIEAFNENIKNHPDDTLDLNDLIKIDLSMTSNNLLISNNIDEMKISGLCSIKGVLFGDPKDDINLDLSDCDLKECYLNSNSGNIIIEYLNTEYLNTKAKSGNVILDGVNAKNVSIEVASGNVIINNCKVDKIIVISSTGNITINSNEINEINTKSDVGNIIISSSTNNIICNTLGNKFVSNSLSSI